MTAGQLRPARALIGWTREQLSKASGVSVATLARLERMGGSPQHRTSAMLRTTLEAAGVEFTDGDKPGVRLSGASA